MGIWLQVGGWWMLLGNGIVAVVGCRCGWVVGVGVVGGVGDGGVPLKTSSPPAQASWLSRKVARASAVMHGSADDQVALTGYQQNTHTHTHF